MNFKQPTTKDNQTRLEVLMMVMMKNTGFWEVTLIFLRNTHQYVAKISSIQHDVTHCKMGFFICHQTFFSMNHTSLLQMP